MLKWVRTILDNGHLAAENESLKKELTKVRKQLLGEIDSNRNREDALIDVIADVRTPRHRFLLPREEEFEDIPTLDFDSPTPPVDENQERLIRLRAADYVAEYSRRGILHDFEDICDRIRKNPEEYLSN